MNGKHLSRVTSLGICLTLWIFSFYLVLQVPQVAVLKLTIINKNTKPCKNHTEVCKCNAPKMYMYGGPSLPIKKNKNNKNKKNKTKK